MWCFIRPVFICKKRPRDFAKLYALPQTASVFKHYAHYAFNVSDPALFDYLLVLWETGTANGKQNV